MAGGAGSRCARSRWIVAVICLAGCTQQPSKTSVVVYTALDSEFSEPILADFSEKTEINARAKFDAESTKTVGLANAIIAEANRPRCDVFWNNEILNTLRLKQRGLLATYRSPAAVAFPEMYRDPDGMWSGFAARARILIVNTKLVPKEERPASIYDLANANWRGRIGIAKPLFGTTATHAAVLFSVLGEEAAKDYFRSLKANQIKIESGNKQVAVSVATGESAFGLTDTDDALVMIDRGYPVEIVYPDQADDQFGTLFIPNTLAITKDCPHPEEARRLVDYLLQPAVEKRLAEGESGQIPLNPQVTASLRVKPPGEKKEEAKPMKADFNQALEYWDAAATFIRDEFAVE